LNAESTRTVEVIRVGTIGLDVEYPGKQIVRLRDISALYEGGQLTGLAEAKELSHKYTCGKKTQIAGLDGQTTEYKTYDGTALPGIFACLPMALEDLHDRLKGKRLAGVNVNVWDQISGAYLGPHNTDRHGTLILPTDREFVEVLQWQLAGGGYSDCFNGELARGMPGLFFYFPCNEGAGSIIKSFPGVSGQQATLPPGWDWYRQGFFARPALKVPAYPLPLELSPAESKGRSSFQFLWYCADPGTERNIFSFADAAFTLDVNTSGKLQGALWGYEITEGTTDLQAETWYVIQINVEMVGGWNPAAIPPAYEYWLAMEVYLGGKLEFSITPEDAIEPPLLPGFQPTVQFKGDEGDGFDEIRNLARFLYPGEIANYALFLKNGRVPGKSQGDLGEPGW
jgi:hypothetical protein